MKYLFLILFLSLVINLFLFGQTIDEKVTKTDFPIFWLLQDKQIEDHDLIEKELKDIVSAGFEGVHVMLRATRYHIFDKEVIEASQKISDLC